MRRTKRTTGEALEAAGWQLAEGPVYVAVEHSDPQTPIGLAWRKHVD